MNRKYFKTWRAPLLMLAIALAVLTSLVVLPTVLAKIGVNLDQFQNGHPPPTGAGWANGSINAQNSAYHEGQSIPFRYFVTGLTAGSTHHFTIQWEYKKGGKAAYDYLTSFDRSFAAGLQCSTVATAVPSDCGTSTASATFPDPAASSNPGQGYLPFTPNVAAAQRQLTAYNVLDGSISFSAVYVASGTDSDPELNITVTFTAINAGSAGFFWGGHLARAPDWNGVGASSISGAPFHMRTQNFDDAGATNQDRSVQPGAILPEAGCGIEPIGAVCGGAETTYSSPGTAAGATYLWSITGDADFIVGGNPTTANQTTTTVLVKAHASGSYTLTLTTDGSGFETQTCTLLVTVNANPVVAIVADTTACAAPSLTASGAVAGDTINWTGPSGGIPTGTEHNATIFPTKTGTYTVQIIRNTCPSNTASGDICFNFVPSP